MLMTDTQKPERAQTHPLAEFYEMAMELTVRASLGDDSAEARARLVEWAEERLAREAELLAELRNIADADPSKWDEEVRGQFQEWAQSRARAAIRKAADR